MGYASTSIASGHCARVTSCPSVRSYLTAGGAVASAGILALSLVAALSPARVMGPPFGHEDGTGSVRSRAVW